MINIGDNNKKDCCGCTACLNICLKGAITMREDSEGFLYPSVDKKKCINCGLCNNVCPILKKKESPPERKIKKSYAIRAKKEDVLMESTSGGFFTPIAEYVLEQDGIVVGVGYNKNMEVEHLIIDKTNINEASKLKGSKYVQSYLNKTYKRIKDVLNQEKMVLFSGTPCQVEGLLSYLGKSYDNLITVDLICHGVPSPKIWKLYREYLENKYKSKIVSVNFRNKTYGYHSHTMKIVFENKKVYYGSGRIDLMLKPFQKAIDLRPACHDCKFKSKCHASDYTIFDCWHADKLNKDINDDDKGYSNLFINTQKGKEFFYKIKDRYLYYDTKSDEAIKYDGIMVEKSKEAHPDREKFYNYIEKHSINDTVNKFLPITKKDKIIESSKKFLNKTHILRIAKRIVDAKKK